MSEIRENSISIYDAMQNIISGKYIMPSFQRTYVWNMNQIEKLWDSILQGYPISTFLFWHIDENNVSNDTKINKFMQDVTFDFSKSADGIEYYSENANLNVSDTAVLDGQQRFTSLFVSLFGNAYIRMKNQRRNNAAKIETRLVIELNEAKVNFTDEYNEKKYDIRFTDKIGLLGVTQFEIKKIITDNGFKNPTTRESRINGIISNVPIDSREYARKILTDLCAKIYDEKLIRYTEIIGMNHDDALEMFVRFNSGGTKLTKSDITMSILDAYWSNSKANFSNLLSGCFEGFGIDFIVRTAHMIYGDVVKSNINRQVANDLKNNWQSFKKAFDDTAQLLESENISISRFKGSWNVLVPIIYFIYNQPNFNNYKDILLKYLYRAILLTYFSSGTTGKLQALRNAFIACNFEINMDVLNQIIRVTDAHLQDLMNYEKGNRVTGEILYYISLNFIDNNIFYEQDHLHPYNRFNQARPADVDANKWLEWRRMANRVPNLHLLYGRANAQKSDMQLQDYYDQMTPTQQEEFIQKSFIPDQNMGFENFENFYNGRKELLLEKLRALLL